MKVLFSSNSKLDSIKSDFLAVAFAHDESGQAFKPDLKSCFPAPFSKKVNELLTQAHFVGKRENLWFSHTFAEIKSTYLGVFGLGKFSTMRTDKYRIFGGNALKKAHALGCKKLAIVLPEYTTYGEKEVGALIEGIFLSSYHFDKYFSEKRKCSVETVEIIFSKTKPKFATEDLIEKARIISDSVFLTRDLINEGPCDLHPVRFAQIAQAEGKKAGLKVQVLDEKQLEKERMNLMLAVGRAASVYSAPRLVRLEYRPAKKAKRHFVLVGKGLTFDSGGLSIKTASGMEDMKTDMSGAAAVLGIMIALAKLKPSIAVTGYMAIAENGVDGHSYHPGDVIISRKGISVEINNTDAEGRLVLADAMDYALEKDKPDVLIDLATLTGACMVALGVKTAGLYSTDDALAESIRAHGKDCGEDFWRLPLNKVLYSSLRSEVADMKNCGDRHGGSITAALFLKKFLSPGVQWAHLDIAGPARSYENEAYIPKGGSGFAARTLIELILQQK